MATLQATLKEVAGDKAGKLGWEEGNLVEDGLSGQGQRYFWEILGGGMKLSEGMQSPKGQFWEHLYQGVEEEETEGIQ